MHLSNVYSIPMPPSLSNHPHGGQCRAAVPVSPRCLLRPPRTGITTTQMLGSPQHHHGHSPPPRQPQQPQPPVQPSTTPPVFDPKQWLNDPILANKAGQSMSYALKLLGLGLGASEIEVKIRYRQLAREYHPDKNNQEVTGLTLTEASDLFKLLNNANMFLQGQM